MNLRIAENSFRFRITPADLDMLLKDHDVDLHNYIGAHCFTYRISPRTLEKHMILEVAAAGFCLFVPKATLADLRDLGRSKEGISVRQGDTEISLQLDIKTQIKKAA
ncbi:MAG: DUF7009 family protein [Micavibrio sp.]